MLFLFIALAYAQQECPRALYCSNIIANCQARCGGGSGTFLLSTKPCIANAPGSYFYCSCAAPLLSQSCSIPIYDACINPATNEQECFTQGGTLNIVFNSVNLNCSVRDCMALSTDNTQIRVPTPATPSPKPTPKPSSKPSSMVPTPNPVINPTQAENDVSAAKVFFLICVLLLNFFEFRCKD